ncbi:hypothetical protein R3P38DRAFT_3202094 [Favolaschia claudopus]|uniref:Uncharacterized protein n=1 Tax=Favolaschia claudopus TaxID=2862362 RepID=A0AAW0ATF3_9AGAR
MQAQWCRLVLLLQIHVRKQARHEIGANSRSVDQARFDSTPHESSPPYSHTLAFDALYCPAPMYAYPSSIRHSILQCLPPRHPQYPNPPLFLLPALAVTLGFYGLRAAFLLTLTLPFPFRILTLPLPHPFPFLPLSSSSHPRPHPRLRPRLAPSRPAPFPSHDHHLHPSTRPSPSSPSTRPHRLSPAQSQPLSSLVSSSST